MVLFETFVGLGCCFCKMTCLFCLLWLVASVLLFFDEPATASLFAEDGEEAEDEVDDDEGKFAPKFGLTKN